jgi:RimJ/RimL family protein N-acetyltransferase
VVGQLPAVHQQVRIATCHAEQMALLAATLSADGLELRSWNPTFVDTMLIAIQESLPELALWMHWAQTMPTGASLRGVLAQGKEDFDADRKWDYSMFETQSGDLVGGAGLHRSEVPSCFEIGYWVHSHRTGKGYATIAARALVGAAFRYLNNASQIMIRMDVGNLASASVPPKLGFSLIRQEDREILAKGHTGRGYVWTLNRPR